MTPSKTKMQAKTTLQLRRKRPRSGGWLLGGAFLVIAIAFVWPRSQLRRSLLPVTKAGDIAPLAMEGGDPHLRALLRTISASESNDASPYTILYGGTHVADLSHHPDRCLLITTGPNKGKCTTAAGRYQFITSTWEEKAPFYHPEPSGVLFWRHYSYEAVYQDWVVYNWLADPDAWDIDIKATLKQGEIEQVLQTLSGTWTSLGSGIEDNWFTPYLPEIYQDLLEQELKQGEISKVQ